MTSETVLSRKLLLTVDNYYIWTMAMEGELDEINALDIVLGDELKPLNDENKISEYDKKNRKAYNLILKNLDSDNLSYVAGSLPPEDKRNGVAIWSLLKNHYQSDDFVNKTLAFSQFNDVKFENNINEFVSKIRTTVQKTKLVGLELKEELLIILTLVKLPNTFDYLKKATDYKDKSIDFLLKKLEQDHAQDCISTTSDLTQEMQALFNNRSPCLHCKKTGHPPNNCWFKYPEKAPNPKLIEEKETHYITF